MRLTTSLEVEERMIAQNDTLDEAVYPRAIFSKVANLAMATRKLYFEHFREKIGVLW